MTAPAHLAPRDRRRSWVRTVAGAVVVVALGTGTVVAIGAGDDESRCELAEREAQKVRAYWDVLDDQGLSNAQVSVARITVRAADALAARFVVEGLLAAAC